jgi:hypothetical protein
MKWLYLVGGVALGGSAAYFIAKKMGLLPSLPSWPSRPSGLGAGVPAALPAAGLANALATHVRQIRRYAFAASQDRSPIVGITHASYALVLLDTLEEIVGRDAIAKAGYDAGKLRKFITDLQDGHAKVLEKCDSYMQNVLAIERAEGGPTTPGLVAGGAPLGA